MASHAGWLAKGVGRHVCVFLKSSSDPAPVLRALVSPRGTRERLRWHPAVGCGDDASPCEWANA